jgi:hypothetical protein
VYEGYEQGPQEEEDIAEEGGALAGEPSRARSRRGSGFGRLGSRSLASVPESLAAGPSRVGLRPQVGRRAPPLCARAARLPGPRLRR